MKYQNKELSENIKKLVTYMKNMSKLKNNSITAIPLSFTDIKNIELSNQLGLMKLN